MYVCSVLHEKLILFSIGGQSVSTTFMISVGLLRLKSQTRALRLHGHRRAVAS